MGISMDASQPRITISSLESDDILLMGPSSPEFDAAFKPGRLREYDGVLPYTVVIKNASPQEVIAYSVVWNGNKARGSVTLSVRSVYDFSNLQPGAHLRPQSREIVSMSMSLEAGGLHWDPYVEHLIALYSECAEVNIALDAVLFSDGSASGADTAGWIPRWKAWLDAEKEVLTKVAEASPSQVRDLLHNLAERGSAIARVQSAGADPPFSVMAVLADHANSYEECLDLARAYFALSTIDQLDSVGAQALADIRATLLKKQYPAVHRKRKS